MYNIVLLKRFVFYWPHVGKKRRVQALSLGENEREYVAEGGGRGGLRSVVIRTDSIYLSGAKYVLYYTSAIRD